MVKKKQKYYVVWKGHKTGIFESWDDCKSQLKDFKGAKYKSFTNLESAKKALKESFKKHVGKNKKFVSELSEEKLLQIGKPNYNSMCVDAASSGNPGKMEYRGVDTETKKELFKQGPFEETTNNIGEFLAIVHALALLKKKRSSKIVYTDSRTALSWVKKKNCNTKLKRSEENKPVFELVDRAVHWLKNNDYNTKIVKWETKAWGEIPADFGRK